MADNDYTKPVVDVPAVLQQNKLGTASESIDRVSQTTSVGSLLSAIGDSIYGINHRQTPNSIQINKDLFGLTFFTRPRLNLTTENIRAIRQFTPLLTNETASLQRIIRCLLCPDLAKKGVSSPLVDSQQAFIPILSNHLLSMSGWPDLVAPTMTSHEGGFKEAFSMVDGVTEILSTYDISANFRNIPGDPITTMFAIWCHYASLVYRGEIVPFPDELINNRIDYNTRIYRLVLDYSKTKVQKIAACGAAFPISAPTGAAFNFEADRPINSSNDQISVPFRCMGAIYNDPILIAEFNQTVCMFNDGMKDSGRAGYYKKVPLEALGIFNHRGYPRINPDTYELEWWVDKGEYTARIPNSTQ